MKIKEKSYRRRQTRVCVLRTRRLEIAVPITSYTMLLLCEKKNKYRKLFCHTFIASETIQ